MQEKLKRVIPKALASGAIVLLAFALVACGDSNATQDQDTNLVDVTSDGGEDIPPDPDAVPVGLGCDGEEDCNGGICASLLTGGYCTQSCDGVECPAGSTCSVINDFPFCMKSCSEDSQCRQGEGYSCVEGICDIECTSSSDCATGQICAANVCKDRPTGNLAVGTDCSNSADCASGYCLQELDGGVCSEPCTPGCSKTDWSCRPLQPIGFAEALNLCGPGGEFTAEVLELDGGNPFTFNVQGDVIGIMIVAESSNPGGNLIIQNITAPDGTEYSGEINQGGYTEPYRLTPSQGHSTAVIPYNSDPNLQVQPGTWSFELAGDFNAQISRVRVFLKRQAAGGQPTTGTFDLNIYLPQGAFSGISASNAAENNQLQGAIGRMRDDFWSARGLRIGTVNYYDIDSSFSVVGDYEELISMRANASIGEEGALDVFLVRDVLGQGVAGIAGGIPGPVGVPGTGGSGVVAELYEWPAATGDNMTHELGHFLSFYHVSELQFSQHDVISDTPRCSRTPAELLNSGQYDPCMDNVMFPTLLTGSGVPQSLSNEQGLVGRLNPRAK